MVSVDLVTTEQKLFFLILLQFQPLMIIFAALILCLRHGPYGLIGILTILCLIPIQNFFQHRANDELKVKVRLADEKIKLTNELIEGVRLIKMYAWQEGFKQLI
jgi:ABC-type bacteriocin/lantibiotic exporter with double-glycine peptidase domain